MTDNAGTPPTTVRWEDPDGSWWIISWDPDLGRYDATKFTHGDAREERIVDDVGFGDRHITTVEELAAQMNRTLPPEVVHDLETAAGAPTQLAMTPVVEATERPMGTRYRIDESDGTWWELGWDKPLGTFYATRLADDGAPGHKVMEDYGNGLSEIGTIAALGDVIGQAIPPPISHELAADAAAHPFTVTPRFLPGDRMVVITPDPSDGSARAAELARWEARLRAQQAELEAFAAALTGQNRVEPLWALPSEPVTLALRMLNRDMGGESDLATFAGRLGVSPALAADLASGRSFALDIDRISQVCEALRCSPYDLWGPDLAQRILHAYGPERWPSHIEPLADGRELPSSLDEFRRRQLDADHAAHVTTLNPPIASLAAAPSAPAEPVPDPDPDEKPPRSSRSATDTSAPWQNYPTARPARLTQTLPPTGSASRRTTSSSAK
jgi:DNA-binding Xre family transcriptional regulator